MLADEPSERPRRWALHLPAWLMLAAVSCLLIALARPQASLLIPSRMESVMLAIDISGSMRATDVKPNRLAAAQSAARTFIEQQPAGVRVGIVSIAGAAAIVQSPTRNRQDLFDALERFQLQRGTALGSGLILALATALPEAGIDVELFIHGRSRRHPEGAPTDRPGEPETPVAPGANRTTAIVLLSDGQSNTGPDPMKAAEVAARHGVRVYTVGVGSTEGATLSADGWSMRVRLDESTLKRIAQVTGAEYFRADNAAELSQVYRALGVSLAFDRQQRTEVTAMLAVLGALLAAAGGLLALARTGRIL